jgi:hypothetical protein
MASLLTADIHQTDAPGDSYRWRLFPWLIQMVKLHKVKQVLILGDLTERKDRHPSSLLNRMAGEIAELRKFCAVIILKGNHDYIDPACPYFGFLSLMENVGFITEPVTMGLPIVGDKHESCLFLPSDPEPLKGWQKIIPTFNEYRYIFCHQTFKGALYENGQHAPDGVPLSIFHGFKGKVYSGDIHVPQRFGFASGPGPEYIGSPYRIDFGDRFTPRALLLKDDGSKADLRFPCPSKHLIEITADGELGGLKEVAKGDFVKIRAILRRADFPLWPKLRAQVAAMAQAGGWQIAGSELRASDGPSSAPKEAKMPLKIDRRTLVAEFAKKQALDADLAAIGQEIIANV